MEQKYKRFNELENWFEQENTRIFEELRQDIQQLTQFPIKFNFGRIDKGWQGQRAKLRTEVVFIKKDGMESFGSDFTMEFDRNELIFNYGCVGHFGKESIYYIERTKLLAKLFDKWEELEQKYLEKLNNPTFTEYFDLYYELERYERNLKERVQQETYNKTLETIKPGQAYWFGNGNDMYGVITRITPKRVYYKMYWKNWHGNMVYSGEKFDNQKSFVHSVQEKRFRIKED